MMLQERTWLLIGRKMAEEASPLELKELEGILKNNPELHFTLQTLADIWKQSPPQDYNTIESAYYSHLNKMRSQISDAPGNTDEEYDAIFTRPEKQRHLRYRSRLAIFTATASVLLVSAALFIMKGQRTANKPIAAPVSSEISTRNGSKTNIVLPDGTKVWLNAGSKLTYEKNYGEHDRAIQLSGEAYFDVVHNPEKPFVIHTTAMDIKVLGTEFNVKSYPDETTTEASLIRGSIEVTLKDKRAEKIIMKPNEKLVVSNEIKNEAFKPALVAKNIKHSLPLINLGHLNYFSLDSTILETSWVNNRLIFEDESFAEVATRMSRWYGVDFNFTHKEIQNLRFTGNFQNETVVEALKAMQITADFKFNISDKHINISKN